MAVVAPPGSSRPYFRTPLRILTAVPLCDGHDSAITTINLELVRHGAEVVYLGYHQEAAAIARAAVQEDVHAVGLSSYNGGHLVFFKEVLAELRARGGADIPVFGGGGGTITAADERAMSRAGVHRIFFAGTPLDAIVAAVKRDFDRPRRERSRLQGDRALARAITLADSGKTARPQKPGREARATAQRGRQPHVTGVAGPGGAGKSTLIDELTSRFLRANANGRVAILANDPSHPGARGALLGDRVSALHAQDDRVFFRSLATRGHPTGLAASVPAVLKLLRASGQFDLIFVESIGVGQESDPFHVFGAGPRLADTVLFVLAPHYGGRIQLQKIALLDGAELVALNKCDDPRATTARAELAARLATHGENHALHATIAARHNDPGIDGLYAAIAARAGFEPPGGEKACQLEACL